MYISGTYITDPIGNNEFSYQERIALGSVGEIFVPSLIQGNLEDLEEGSEIVFEEAEFTESRNGGMVNNKLISCVGLKHFIQLEYKGIPVYIVDNHNHVLTFWSQVLKAPLIKGEASADADGGFVKTKNHLVVLHIDQHSDVKPNNEQLQGNRESFVNEKTNVGNFISAALNNKIIDEVIQVRTDYALKNILNSTFGIMNYIIDIDIDFRVDKEITEEEIGIIRELIQKAQLVTIATSPYFIDQNKAIIIIKKILAK